jgi:hypothetical protein
LIARPSPFAEIRTVNTDDRSDGGKDRLRMQLFYPQEPQPILDGKAEIAEHSATQRFKLPGLHATLVKRMVLGYEVVGHQHIIGIGDAPMNSTAVLQVNP